MRDVELPERTVSSIRSTIVGRGVEVLLPLDLSPGRHDRDPFLEIVVERLQPAGPDFDISL